MGAGHAAVALGASKLAPRLNVGWLVFAAFLADFLLGLLCALGLEHASVPADFASQHYLLFTFPYSHGLVPLLLWSAVAGLLLSLPRKADRKRIFLVVAAVVLSHFVLDGLVHVAGLPLAGENSPKFGLGLWKHHLLELWLETAMVIAAIAIYSRLAGPGSPAISRYGVPIFMVLLTVLTWMQIFGSTPPDPAELAPAWIIAPVVFAALAYALDWKRAARAQALP